MPKGCQVPITPQQDDIIRKCWEHNAYGHHAAKRAAQLAGLTPEVVQRRATQLGLVFTRERYRWTEPELRVVEKYAHLALDTIQKKLRLVSPPGVKRTRAAIAGQIFAQRFRTNLDGLKHGPLAEALGISNDRLHKLRNSNLIKGERLESIAQTCGYLGEVLDDNRHWFYANDEIVRLLFAARGELDLRKVNQTWLLGVLEPYITLFQPSPKDVRLAERERTKLAHRRQRKKLRRAPTQMSTDTRPPGLLDEAAVNAIRAGRKRLRRTEKCSSGDPACPASSIDTGTISMQSGGGTGTSNGGKPAATSPSVTPFSGLAGGPNAV